MAGNSGYKQQGKYEVPLRSAPEMSPGGWFGQHPLPAPGAASLGVLQHPHPAAGGLRGGSAGSHPSACSGDAERGLLGVGFLFRTCRNLRGSGCCRRGWGEGLGPQSSDSGLGWDSEDGVTGARWPRVSQQRRRHMRRPVEPGRKGARRRAQPGFKSPRGDGFASEPPHCPHGPRGAAGSPRAGGPAGPGARGGLFRL